ncbi:MAG: leucine-rich repeat domain-containing protein [Candidatus Hodarchaeales archaeon]|jgi:Leucine-rich repeat (LRR) protein
MSNRDDSSDEDFYIEEEIKIIDVLGDVGVEILLFDQDFPIEDFNKLKKLIVQPWTKGIGVRGFYHRNNLVVLALSNVKVNLSEQIKFDLTNVQLLFVKDCELDTSFAEFVEKMVSLISIELNNVDNLEIITNNGVLLSRIEKLEISNLSKSFFIEKPEEDEIVTLDFPDMEGECSLKSLSLYGSRISCIPENIGNLTSLENLSIEATTFPELPDNIGNLENLNAIYFRKNSFTELPESFGNLSNLETITIEKNNLKQFPDSFGNLKNLKQLWLTYSRINSLPDSFGELENIEDVIIYYTELSTLPESFGNLKSLASLDLHSNELVALPENFGSLEKLGYLSLDRNQIDHLPESFGNLKSLEILDLHSNELVALPENFGNLESLQSLDLSNNKLQSLPVSLKNLKNLYFLDLRGNKLVPEMFNSNFGITYPYEVDDLDGLSDLDDPDEPRLTVEKGTKIVRSFLDEIPGDSSIDLEREEATQYSGIVPIDISKTRCLSIGINDYSLMPTNRLRSLNYAVKDAAKLTELFLEKRIPNTNLQLLVDNWTDDLVAELIESLPQCKIAQERNNLNRVFPFRSIIFNNLDLLKANNDIDTFIFYFAGHGIRQSSIDYIIPYDGSFLRVDESFIPIKQLLNEIENIRARLKIIIIDACRSQEPSRDAVNFGKDLQEYESEQLMYILLSCQPDEKAFESEELNQGVFTHFLVEGLQRGTLEDDEVIKLSALKDYMIKHISEFVRERFARDQTPDFRFRGNLDFHSDNDLTFWRIT